MIGLHVCLMSRAHDFSPSLAIHSPAVRDESHMSVSTTDFLISNHMKSRNVCMLLNFKSKVFLLISTSLADFLILANGLNKELNFSIRNL